MSKLQLTSPLTVFKKDSLIHIVNYNYKQGMNIAYNSVYGYSFYQKISTKEPEHKVDIMA